MDAPDPPTVYAMSRRYSNDELEAVLADIESDLAERKESLKGDSPGEILNERRRHGDAPFDAQPLVTAEEPIPTVTGMLVLGARPQDFVPGAYVQFLRIAGTIQQHGVRLKRPVKAYDRWARRMPAEYARSVLDLEPGRAPQETASDPNCIATVKHYRSLVPLAQEARKPIFGLAPADGAIGSHAVAANEAYNDFKQLAGEILRRVES